MIRFFKFSLLALLLLPIAFFVFKNENNSIKSMGFDGVVVAIDWKSKNHNLPLIKIRKINSTRVIDLSHYAIIFKKGDLDVGDKIKKVKGSHECFVNDVVKKCIM